MGLGRVELPTSRLSGVRSNHLSYRPSCAATTYRMRRAFSLSGDGVVTNRPLHGLQPVTQLSSVLLHAVLHGFSDASSSGERLPR